MTMMPEGPEIRALVDRLQPALGRRLVRIEFLSGRYHGEEANKISSSKPPGYGADFFNNAIVSSWKCKGKFMYVQLRKENHQLSKESGEKNEPVGVNNEVVDDDSSSDHQLSLWITLGLTGKFFNEADHQGIVQRQLEQRESPQSSRHSELSATTATTARWFLELQDRNASTISQEDENESHRGLSRIYYHDPRGFGTLKFCRSRTELLKKLESLGPDLLANSTTETDFVSLVTASRPSTNICRLLMDQSKISGVGNYLLAEGLYKALVDPFCSVEELNRTQLGDLFRALRDTATQSYRSQIAIAQGGGQDDSSSTSDNFQLHCYGRDRCLLRNDPVRRETHGPHGRTIWYTDAQLFVPRSERGVSRGGGLLPTQTTTNDNEASMRANFAVEASKAKSPTAKRRKCSEGNNGTAVGSVVETKSTSFSGDWLLKALKEGTWREELAPHLATQSFRQLAQFLEGEFRSGTVYPLPSEVFAALNLVPIDSVRVVIVGQDPYHGPGQAHGLAFSVPRGVRKLPPSLRNILKELQDDLGMSDPPKSGCLTPWAKQGVLLLNTVLTVRAGEPLSHANRGWEEFTDAVLEAVASRHSDSGVVFLLWGNPAQAKARNVLSLSSSKSSSMHAVIKTSHPSPLAATKTSSPFLGSRCFSRANVALIERSYDPIDWSLS
jgi:uracil-DNA glycosylase